MSDIDSDAPRLTQAAFDRLQTEVDELRTSGRKQMAQRLQRARELGDLSENAEYHETKNQQGMMEARIRKIEHILKNAQIVDTPMASDHAEAGTIVTLKPLDGGEDERYLLAASKIGRLAIGDPTIRPVVQTYQLPYLTLRQEERMSEGNQRSAGSGVWRADSLSAIHAVFGFSVLVCLVMAIMSLGL